MQDHLAQRLRHRFIGSLALDKDELDHFKLRQKSLRHLLKTFRTKAPGLHEQAQTGPGSRRQATQRTAGAADPPGCVAAIKRLQSQRARQAGRRKGHQGKRPLASELQRVAGQPNQFLSCDTAPMGLPQPALGQHQIDVAQFLLGEQGFRKGNGQFQIHQWMLPREALQNARQGARGQIFRQPETDAPAQTGGQEIAFHPFGNLDHPAGFGQQLLACRCQRNGVRVPFEQAILQIGFQPSDMLADRRLPDPEVGRSPAETATFKDREKTSDLCKVEHAYPVS